MGADWKQLYTWYLKEKNWRERILSIVEASFYHRPKDALSQRTAELLYGRFLQNSVTRLENFSACAYAHFLTYGLKLRERESYQFQAVDLGNLFHSAMERFADKLTKAEETWTLVTESLRDKFIEESVEECIVDYGNSVLYSSARNEYIITRLKRMMRRTVWAVIKQLERGDFVPNGYEIVYDSGMISLDDYKRMRLHGKIDRVDVCETEDNVYVKVIDYKTGFKEFDLGEIYHGLQLQLILYMNAAMDMEAQKHMGKKIIPAGLFYYKMQDPVVKRVDDDFEREELILKELRLDGIVNQSDDVIEHMDREISGSSLVLPVTRNKDGSLSKTSKVLSEEEFSVVSQFARRKMKDIGNQIMKGDTTISPYMAGEQTPCKYCPYKVVCGFDEKIEGYEYRRLDKFGSKDEVIEVMKKEVTPWE